MLDRLEDGHGRPIGDVRISVTDRCNFRCQYCMPAEGLAWLERGEILTFEEHSTASATESAPSASSTRSPNRSSRSVRPTCGSRCAAVPTTLRSPR
jgi:hypothetical protein